MNDTDIGFMLKTRTEELAEELGLPHKDEINLMCEHQIARENEHWCSIYNPNKEARIRDFEEVRIYLRSSCAMSEVSFSDMI